MVAPSLPGNSQTFVHQKGSATQFQPPTILSPTVWLNLLSKTQNIYYKNVWQKIKTLKVRYMSGETAPGKMATLQLSSCSADLNPLHFLYIARITTQLISTKPLQPKTMHSASPNSITTE
jgi:hypothetical protein